MINKIIAEEKIQQVRKLLVVLLNRWALNWILFRSMIPKK